MKCFILFFYSCGACINMFSYLWNMCKLYLEYKHQFSQWFKHMCVYIYVCLNIYICTYIQVGSLTEFLMASPSDLSVNSQRDMLILLSSSPHRFYRSTLPYSVFYTSFGNKIQVPVIMWKTCFSYWDTSSTRWVTF